MDKKELCLLFNRISETLADVDAGEKELDCITFKLLEDAYNLISEIIGG